MALGKAQVFAQLDGAAVNFAVHAFGHVQASIGLTLFMAPIYSIIMSNIDKARQLIDTHDVQAVASLLDDNARLQARLANEVVYLQNEIKAERGLRSLSGESEAMKAVRRVISQVAPTDSTVLIHGETGTGKELVARGTGYLVEKQAAKGCTKRGPGHP